MKPEEKANLEIWWVLKQIKKLHLIASADRSIEFELSSSNDDWKANEPSLQSKVHIIDRLEKEGALVIKERDYGQIKSVKTGKIIDTPLIGSPFVEEEHHWKPQRFYIKILPPNFKKLYNHFEKLTERYNIEPKNILYLYLDKVGNLWYEPKGKYCYPMKENSELFKIFQHLAENPGFQQTFQIAEALEGKSEKSIRTEVKKIRNNIEKFLEIQGNNVIEGKKGSGYRINPNYKIKIL